MKKLLKITTLIAIVCAVGLLSLAVYYRYENYKAGQKLKVDQVAAQENIARAQTQWKLDDQKKAADAQVAAIKTECLKGKTAYDLLPLATQKKAVAPNCEVTGQ